MTTVVIKIKCSLCFVFVVLMLLTNILNRKTYDASNIILPSYCLLPLVYLCYGT